MYKLSIDSRNNKVHGISRLNDNAWIPLDLSNSDFIEFKRQINEDESQLQDADGNTMTVAEAKEFVATLL